MKKICIYIYSLTSGGAERTTVALAKYLAQRGYEVTIITKCGTDKDFYTVPDGVQRVSLNLNGARNGFTKLTDNLSVWRKLRAHMRENQPDVLIGMMTDSAVMSILSGMMSPVKVMVSERNYPGRPQEASRWHKLRKRLYRRADAHVAQTPESSKWLRENTKAKNVHIIPNSVQWPMESVKPVVSPNLLIPSKKKLVLAVGTKPHQKGFDLLLDAFWGASNDDWVLAILGLDEKSCTVEEHQAILKQLNKLDIKKNVLLPGCVGNIGDWYKRADIFVLSSRYEGFPNALLEAMAAGVPSIAFDCDTGPRDIIDHETNGILVEPENSPELSEAIRQLIKDPKRRKQLSKEAIKVRKDFSEETVLEKWVELIEQVLQGAGFKARSSGVEA